MLWSHQVTITAARPETLAATMADEIARKEADGCVPVKSAVDGNTATIFFRRLP